MFRNILIALVFVSSYCHSETQSDSSSNLHSLYVYDEPLALPPYSDQWFIDGNLTELNRIQIRRDGKSGDLSAPISINCTSRTFTVTGNGLLYTSEPISSSEVSQQISKNVIKAVLKQICGSKNIQ